MITIQIVTPDCKEDEAHVYECFEEELSTVLPGLLFVHEDYTEIVMIKQTDEV